jgi:hypothetical protein
MQSPIQAPPQPRYFMRLIVGREWNPSFDEGVNAEIGARWATASSMQGEQKVRNPCLLQLTTFSLRSARPNGRNLKHAT